MSNTAQEAADLLEVMFPDLTPNERFQEWQNMNLELIRRGSLAALLQTDGNVLFKHVEHCTDAELGRKMTPEQYKVHMHR